MLRTYFFDRNFAHLLTKNKLLPVEQRKKIVNVIVDFILESFGMEPTFVQKVITAQAAIVEFPGLEFTEGEGTVSIFNEFHKLSAIATIISIFF